LFDRCWGGVFVGDDSLNRAIAAVRKLAAEIAGGSFEIETIPRTGYRLAGATISRVSDEPSGTESTMAPVSRVTRRQAIGGGAALALAGAGAFFWFRPRPDPRFAALIERANDQMLKETADVNTVRLLDQAIAIRPDSPKAWGLLALLKSFLSPGVDPKDAGRLVDESEKAARRALSLDPKQPDALLAMFELQGSTLDWIARDRNLREIVAIDPTHIWAMAELASLTAATGLVRESWAWNERCLALQPLSSEPLGRRALKLWVFGRTAEADKVSDRLRALYPDDPWAWFVRAQIFAFTGRVSAALAMLGSAPAPMRPVADLWRASLPALDRPSSANVAKAQEACNRAFEASGMATNEAILVLSQLRELDSAFDIASGSLLSRGPLVPRDQPGSHDTAGDAGWRVNTQWMWTPPVAAMRTDRRFLPLCDGVGLSDYWKKRGVKPDYMRATI
jgi:tetratricopeptide (TPR) repeat protein